MDKTAFPSSVEVSVEKGLLTEEPIPRVRSGGRGWLIAVGSVTITLLMCAAAFLLCRQFLFTPTQYSQKNGLLQSEHEHLARHEDLNLGVSVFRIDVGGNYNCYLLAKGLDNMSPEAQQSFLQSIPETVEEESSELSESTKHKIYLPADEPITDISFLGDNIKEYCEGMPIFWLTSDVVILEERDNDDKHIIDKRSEEEKRRCRYTCGVQCEDHGLNCHETCGYRCWVYKSKDIHV